MIETINVLEISYKQVFAEGVSKVVPIIGGVVTGGLSYVTFKPCVVKLRNSFKELPLSDTQFYKEQREKGMIDLESVDILDEESEEVL